MGSSSSILDEKKQIVSKELRSVKNDFNKEFGDVRGLNEVSVAASANSTTEKPTGSATAMLPAIIKAKTLLMRPVFQAHQRDSKNLLVKKKDKFALLKELYCLMDPGVADSWHIAGDLAISAKYRPVEGKLLVKVMQAKKLSKEALGRNPDPYVRIDLLAGCQDQPLSTAKTKVVTNTCDPIFQEIVVFDLPESGIPEASLRFSVWDKDSMSEEDFLGECIMEVCKMNLNDGGTVWRKLLPKIDNTITGQIVVTVDLKESYDLVVTVHEARNLKATNLLSKTSDPYVRIHITGLSNKQETQVIRKTLNPVWEESKIFCVHPDEVARRIIVLSVMDRSESGHEKRMGDVHIPLSGLTLNGRGARRTSYDLKDLRNTPQTRSKWSEEGLVMEFREALRAHAIYDCPKFLFKKQHHGTMLVSVHSTKARTQAKMVLANGVPVIGAV